MNIKDILEPSMLSAIKNISQQYTALKLEEKNRLIQAQIEAFRNIAPGLNQSLILQSQASLKLKEKNRLIPAQIEAFRNITPALNQSLTAQIQASKEINESFSLLSKQLLEFRSPLQEAVEQIQRQISLFQKTTKQFREFQRQLDFTQITDNARIFARKRLVKLRLHSEYWLINDDLLLAEIYEAKDIEGDALSKFIVDYYKVNNWERLDHIVSSWQNLIFPGRMNIFRAAIYYTKSANETDIHLLNVRTLIPEIDGLVRDLYSILPKDMKKRIRKIIIENLPEENKKKNKRVDTRPDEVVGSIAEIIDFSTAEIFDSVIYEGLFKNSNQITDGETYLLYRHPIIHANKDFLNYGKEEYFIRLILYADFIIDIIRRINNDSVVINDAAYHPF